MTQAQVSATSLPCLGTENTVWETLGTSADDPMWLVMRHATILLRLHRATFKTQMHAALSMWKKEAPSFTMLAYMKTQWDP